MKIGIIGSGRIGGNIGTQLARAGHQVMFSFARDPHTLEGLAEGAPQATTAEPAEAASSADVVVFSVPWTAIETALELAGSFEGKIVVDTTNPFGRSGLERLPDGLTAAEANAQRMQGARLAKVFNTLTAGYQREVADGRVTGPIAMFFATEDELAAPVVEQLVRDCGFEPVRIGGWREVHLMEAPRREGAVYGEAYRPEDARRIAAAAAESLDLARTLARQHRIE